MEREVRGRVLWELFVTLHLVFIKALPKKNLAGNNDDLSTKNDITKIRYYFRAIPLTLRNASVDETKLDSTNFSRSLYSLLEVLETLVSSSISEVYVIQNPDFDDPQEQSEFEQLHTNFTNLMTMREVLRSENLVPGQPASPSMRQRDTVLELAKYVEFVDLKDKRKYSSSEILKSISDFRSAVDKLLQDPIKSRVENLGNASRLTQDESSYIRKACYFNNLSKNLFSLLVSSVKCSRIHTAKLHLSGFLTSDASFEMVIADCKKEHWHSAKCKWTSAPLQIGERYRTEQIVCAVQRDQEIPRHVCIASGQEGVWDVEIQDEEIQDNDSCNPAISDQQRTLKDMIQPKHQDAIPGTFKLEAYEMKTIQLLIACSLLNLDTSHWIPLGLDIDKISLRMARGSSSPLPRWKPHVTSLLQTADDGDDENDVLLSFGLLIMEMEANQVAEPTEKDQNWDGGGFSKDSILRRILEEWAGKVEDDYRNIATACLLFRQLSDNFHDQKLTHDMRRTGAMYKYIFAPLFRLVVQKFQKTQELFTSIPKPADGRSYFPRQPIYTSDMLLFDGSEVAQPTQQQIDHARRFMRELKRFADKIRHVTDSSPSPPDWSPWRKDPIRIAILDTGIDVKQDMLMETALKEKRIQECCGFVIERDSNLDPHDFQDLNGHGTHVTRLILDAAPSAVVFIAKISDEITIRPQNMHRIARAINWATEKKVNIISMSFGLDCRDSDIDQAIHAAVNANISIFAAASNDGGNKPRVYPSSRSHGVLCIHASDGLGNDGGISPTPQRRKDNFSTLGIAIQSKCKGITTHISGTSYATPIAAAFAADVLEFARHKCGLSQHETNVLYHFDGVCKILRLMVEQEVETRGGYDYVMPFHLWTTNRSDDQVAEMITEIVNT